MSKFIEQLETRQLLSVSPVVTADARAVNAESIAIKAQAGSLLPSIKAENNALVSDVHSLHLASNGRRLVSLNHDEQVSATAIKKHAATLQKVESKAVATVVADLRKLSLKPGNADLEAVLSVDKLALQNDTTNTTTALASAYASGISLVQADLNDLAAANPGHSTVQDATAAESDTLSADLTAANAANTILASDVTLLLSDAG